MKYLHLLTGITVIASLVHPALADEDLSLLEGHHLGNRTTLLAEDLASIAGEKSLTMERGERINPFVWELSQQPDPNNDRFLQPQPVPFPLNNEPLLPPPPDTNNPPSRNQTSDFGLDINSILLTGNTVFSQAELDQVLAPYQGRQITVEELRDAASAITQLYLSKGYLNSRAVVPDQPISNGVGEIVIYEGKLTNVEINGLTRLDPNYLLSRLNLAGKPLQGGILEDQLRLLKIDPLFKKFDFELQQGDNLGDTVLRLDVTEANPVFGTASIDNYSAASIGSERGAVLLGYRNLWGLGDIFTANYTRSFTGGSSILDLNYLVPFNGMNGTVQLRGVFDRNEITLSPFDVLGIKGTSQLYELSVRQPLIRSVAREFALSLGFSHKNGQTFLFNDIGTPFSLGANSQGITRTAVLRFGQEYLLRDNAGGWSFRSQFNLGTGLFDATINSKPTPDGRFLSWLGSVQRVQRLGSGTLLLSTDLQLTPDTLLGSETFTIGGAQTLRGYRQGARGGDNGWRFSAEYRLPIVEGEKDGVGALQIAPFFDVGTVWNNPSNPSQIVNEHFLAGIGTGLIWLPFKNTIVRLDLALPLVSLRDRQENLQDDGVYFSVTYAF